VLVCDDQMKREVKRVVTKLGRLAHSLVWLTESGIAAFLNL
jgi:hypothetical protein